MFENNLFHIENMILNLPGSPARSNKQNQAMLPQGIILRNLNLKPKINKRIICYIEGIFQV